MSEWTPFAPDCGRRDVPHGVELVGVLSSGALALSPAVVKRLGAPSRVVLLTTSDPTRLGIRALGDGESEYSYGVNKYGKNGHQVNAYSALWKLGRRPLRRVDVPHRWEGDVLVIDVSALPVAKMGVRP